MAITFLGYIQSPEERPSGGKLRSLYGCDSGDDVASLPTTAGLTLPDGSCTRPPAPWSYALVAGGGIKVLGTAGSWGDLNG